MSRDRPDLLRLLVRMVSAPDLDRSRRVLAPVADQDAGRLLLLARAHGVEAWLAACVPPSWPSQVLADVQAQRLAFLGALAQQRALLSQVGQALDTAAIPWAALKGLALADRVYPRADLRHGVDVDVLVRGQDLGRALDALEAASLVLLDRNWPLLRALEVGELRLRASSGVLLDLHWHLLNDRALRGQFSVSAAAMVDRAVAVPGAGYRRLADVDDIVQVGLHAALSGANRLVWLLDVDLLARQPDLDWTAVVLRARAAGAAPALALVLDRCQAVLGTPVPAGAVVRLAGPTWRALCSAVRRRQVLAADPAAPSLARALSRAARRDTPASLAALMAHGVSWTASWTARWMPYGRRPAPTWLDPQHPTSALHDVPSAADRAGYLERVALSD